MSEGIITALISVVGSVFGSMVLVNWRLKKLEEKVDKHNAWGDKFAAQNMDIAIIKNDMGYIRESIRELKEK